MNWITTNIRFPEDLYMELKMEAARQRRSIADLVRERVSKAKATDSSNNITNYLRELKKVAKANTKAMKGKSLSKLLIEMRYEQ